MVIYVQLRNTQILYQKVARLVFSNSCQPNLKRLNRRVLGKNTSTIFVLFFYLLCSLPTFSISSAATVSCPAQAGTPPCVPSADPGVSNILHLPNVQIVSNIDPVGERVFLRDVDYQDPQSNLALVRYYNSQNTSTNYGFGKGWNMTYAIQLMKISKQQLNLTQSDGRVISFTKESKKYSNRFNAISDQDGYLVKQEKYWKWQKNEADQILFRGPIPVKFIFGDRSMLNLYYKNQRLSSVTDQLGHKLLFHYNNSLTDINAKDTISAVTLPNGNTITYEYESERLISTKTDPLNLRRYFYESAKTQTLLTGTSNSETQPQYQISYNTAGQPSQWQNTTTGQTIDINYSTLTDAKELTESKTISINTNSGESATYQVLTDPDTHRSTLMSSRIKLCPTCTPIERLYRYNASGELMPKHNTSLLRNSNYQQSIGSATIEIERNLISGISTIRAGINSFSFKNNTAVKAAPVTNRNKRIVRKLLVAAMTRGTSATLKPRDTLECELNGPHGQVIESLIDATDPETQEPEPACNSTDPSSGEPITPTPITSTVAGGHIREIWAEGCLSYFDAYLSTGRGFKIEEALALHPDFINAFATATLFPVVDFLLEGTAVAVVSTDLTSASYGDLASDLALYQALIQDAQEMYDKFLLPLEINGQVSATQGGLTTTIRDEDVDTFVFELVIQHNTATPAQLAQILQAAEYMLQHFGIILQIVEIP